MTHTITTMTGRLGPQIRTVRRAHTPKHHIAQIIMDDGRIHNIIMSAALTESLKDAIRTRKLDPRLPLHICVESFRTMDQDHAYMAGAIDQHTAPIFCPTIHRDNRQPWIEAVMRANLATIH